MRALAAAQEGRKSYPDRPGWQGFSALTEQYSRAAADAVAPVATNLRERIFDEIANVPTGLSSDELAERMGLAPIQVRPRTAELHGAGRIMPSRARTKNKGGRTAAVWILAPLASCEHEGGR